MKHIALADNKTCIILDKELELDELRDIVDHGMLQGVPGFIYLSDILGKYTEHKNEITEYLNRFCLDNFNQSMHAYIAEQLSFDDEHWTEQEFIQYAVWMYVECRAHAFIEGKDNPPKVKPSPE
jgi:hypothetical protein